MQIDLKFEGDHRINENVSQAFHENMIIGRNMGMYFRQARVKILVQNMLSSRILMKFSGNLPFINVMILCKFQENSLLHREIYNICIYKKIWLVKTWHFFDTYKFFDIYKLILSSHQKKISHESESYSQLQREKVTDSFVPIFW